MTGAPTESLGREHLELEGVGDGDAVEDVGGRLHHHAALRLQALDAVHLLKTLIRQS